MFTGILVVVLLFLLHRHVVKEKPVEIDGKLLVKFHSTFGLMGIILMVFGVSLPFLFAVMREGFNAMDMLIMLIISVGIAGTGYWTFLVYKNHYVVYDDTEIIVVGLNKKKQNFIWADISDLTLNTLSNNYVLTLKSGEKVKIYKYLSGSNDFVRRSANFNPAS